MSGEAIKYSIYDNMGFQNSSWPRPPGNTVVKENINCWKFGKRRRTRRSRRRTTRSRRRTTRSRRRTTRNRTSSGSARKQKEYTSKDFLLN